MIKGFGNIAEGFVGHCLKLSFLLEEFLGMVYPIPFVHIIPPKGVLHKVG